MAQRRIAILTDLDPYSNPGANLVALEYAKCAKVDSYVEVWSGKHENSEKTTQYDDHPIEIFHFSFSQRFYAFPKRSPKRKTLREFFSFLPILWLIRRTLTSKPDLIWVHQIGNIFPLSVFLIFRVLRIPTVFTLHDFGILMPRKLFPQDLSINNKDLMHLTHSLPVESEKLKLKNSKLMRVQQMRLVIVKYLVKSATLVTISDMQKNILEANNVFVTETIENGVNPCNCENNLPSRLDAILFAGRLNGKGLHHAIDLVQVNDKLTLHLAGSEELIEVARLKLPAEKIIYHGELGQVELFKLLHTIRFTSVMSDCFDVYPSILLEAIVHGSVPFCYPTVGNAIIASALDDSLLVEYGKTPNAFVLSRLSNDVDASHKIIDCGKDLKSFEAIYSRYSHLFKNIQRSKLRFND